MDNYCTRCACWFTKPGTCNCFAVPPLRLAGNSPITITPGFGTAPYKITPIAPHWETTVTATPAVIPYTSRFVNGYRVTH